MPDFEQKRTTTTTDVAAQAERATAPGQRADLRRQAGRVGFEEGQAMLRPERAPVPGTTKDGGETEADAKKKEEERAAAAKKSYEEALGSFLGGKLYDLVHKELSPEKLLGYGKDGLEAMAKAGEDQIGELLGDKAKAAEKFTAALVQWARQKGEGWLEGEDGQAFLTKVNEFVEGHPRLVAGTLVSAALTAAVVAYTSNIDIPELEQTFKLGHGVKATVGAELGKIQDICLEAAQLGLAWEGKNASASVGGTYEKKDGEDVFAATAAFGVKGDKGSANGTAKMTTEGDLQVDASAALAAGGFDLGVKSGVKKPVDGDMSAKTTATVGFGEKSDRHTVEGVFDHTKDTFTLQTSRSQIFEGEGYKLTQDQTHTANGLERSLRGDFSLAPGLGMNFATNQKGGDLQSASLGANYQNDWLKAELDLALQDGKASANASATATHGNLSASGDMKLDLDEGRLSELSLKLGYRDPNEFKGFLLDYSRKWNEDNQGYEDQFHGMLETSLDKVMFRADATAQFQNGDLSKLGVEGLAAYSLNDDLKLIGGARYDMNPGQFDGGRGTALAGVQFKDVPIVVGYTPDTKAWSVGIRIPFGR